MSKVSQAYMDLQSAYSEVLDQLRQADEEIARLKEARRTIDASLYGIAYVDGANAERTRLVSYLRQTAERYQPRICDALLYEADIINDMAPIDAPKEGDDA